MACLRASRFGAAPPDTSKDGTGPRASRSGAVPAKAVDEEDPTSAVARLYDEHGATLYRYALMLLADSSTAEDAVQQVFVSVLRAKPGSRIEQDLPYLRRAVRNECFSLLRRRVARREVPAADVLIEPRPGVDASPDERLAV